MKSTGIVRKLDNLGRVVIPIELRRTLAIDVKEPLEIFVDGDKIVLRAYHPLCYICGGSDGLKDYKGRKICSDCISEAQKY